MMGGVAYDAFVLLSFGGPEKPDDVLPFLRNVVRGRGVPDERLAEVAEHYQHFGGRLPDQPAVPRPARRGRRRLRRQRRQAAHLLGQPELASDDRGHRGADARRRGHLGARLRHQRVRRLFVLPAVLGGHRPRPAKVGPGAPQITKLRQFHDHPGFVEPHADAVGAALATLDPARRATTRLVFTAHSIPASMARTAGPERRPLRGAAHRDGRARARARAAADLPWDLVWQSRSGPPQVPWLEPDVNDHLAALAEQGVTDVVVSPIGFVSDHLEVIWDLDNEAAETAKRLGLGYARAATPGTDPRFVTLIRHLVEERTADRPQERLGTLPVWDACLADCCPPPQRPAPRGA